MGNKFKTKKVGELNENNTAKSQIFFGIFKYFIVLLCVCLVVFFGIHLVKAEKIKFSSFGKNTVNAVSKNFGEEMKKDIFGNVNILLVGVGGDGHQGGFLSDTIIVASRNQEKGAVTMISIPRDLYVKDQYYAGRINGVFARGYYKEKNLGSGAETLIEKLQEMLGLEIPYYAIVDFQGFKDVVDTIGGVELYVPYTINDTTYPDEGLGYEPFYISAGLQMLDGDTALKYARSRHTTSDFSRSQRQQALIKAIVEKATTKENLTNINILTQLYDTYTKMVTTNISSKEMIGAVKYVTKPINIFSFGLNSNCSYSSYKLTDAACFLYNGNRDAFNGMAVILPNGSTPSNVSFYDYIKNFVFFVAYNQGYLLENPRILIKNAIDKTYANQNGESPSGWANKIAVKLKKFGFNIYGTENSDEKIEQTTVVVYGDDYDETIGVLRRFLPINVVKTGQILTGEDLSVNNEEGIEIQELDYDLEIIIGNDFVDYLKEKPFSYEK